MSEPKCDMCEDQGYLICGNCDAFDRNEQEPAALQAQRIAELEAWGKDMIKESVSFEWPDCGKPYYYCNLCGEDSPKSDNPSPSEIKHEPDCLYIQARTLGLISEEGEE